MTCAVPASGGLRHMSATKDKVGHREYKVTIRVASDTLLDGPANAMQATGLAQPGEVWAPAGTDDLDIWAWCQPEMEVVPVLGDAEPNKYWDVTQTFSTRPIDRCQDLTAIKDPLLIPPTVSGGFTSYTEEATSDRFGNPLMNSAWEQLRGSQVEFDRNRPNLKIEMNLPVLNVPLLASMVDTVNGYTLWGMAPRCIKLSRPTWAMKFYGFCQIYYAVTFEFEFRFDTFDRDLVDYGTRALRGRWGKLPGSGLTVNVTVDGTGGVLTAAINAAGSGYLPSAVFMVTVAAGGGAFALLQVTTNAAGNASAVTVADNGAGYTAGNGYATALADQVYILANIGGYPPSRFNPANFVRYRDPNDNPTQCILNGAGLPAGVPVWAPGQGGVGGALVQQIAQVALGVAQAGAGAAAAPAVAPPGRQLFMCINPGGALANVPLTTEASWAPVAPTLPAVWSWVPRAEGYAFGTLRRFTTVVGGIENLYVVSAPAGVAPGNGTVSPEADAGLPSPAWTKIDTYANFLAAGHNRGVWNPNGLNYVLGDYVSTGGGGPARGGLTNTYAAGAWPRPTTPQTFQPGTIHVEKYNESDFLLLGVPINIPGFSVNGEFGSIGIGFQQSGPVN